jgi:hypothetical protein
MLHRCSDMLLVALELFCNRHSGVDDGFDVLGDTLGTFVHAVPLLHTTA